MIETSDLDSVRLKLCTFITYVNYFQLTPDKYTLLSVNLLLKLNVLKRIHESFHKILRIASDRVIVVPEINFCHLTCREMIYDR